MWPRTQNSSARHVLVTNQQVLRRIDVDDGIEVLHLVALRVDPADLLLVGDDLVEVQLPHFKNRLGRHDGSFRSADHFRQLGQFREQDVRPAGWLLELFRAGLQRGLVAREQRGTHAQPTGRHDVLRDA